MTTTRRTAKAAEPADPATTEAPGTAPDAAPGFEQDGPPEVHEPALDEAAPPEAAPAEPVTEAEPYDFAAHWRRVTAGPWPMPDPPVIFTPEARAALREHDRAVAQLESDGHRAHAAAHRAVMADIDQRHRDWYAMRAYRTPQHAA